MEIVYVHINIMDLEFNRDKYSCMRHPQIICPEVVMTVARGDIWEHIISYYPGNHPPILRSLAGCANANNCLALSYHAYRLDIKYIMCVFKCIISCLTITMSLARASLQTYL